MRADHRVWVLTAGGIALAVVPSLILEPHSLRTGGQFFLAVTTLAGLHVITGLSRVVSLCHAALMGVGAYAGAIVALKLGVTPLAGVAIGGLAAAAVAFGIAMATIRLEEHHLALATLAASEILANVFRSATPLTGGANGLSGLPPLSLLGIDLHAPARYYPACATLGLIALAAVAWFETSNYGQALRAGGDEGLRVESLGVSTASLRSLAFVVGGGLAGLSGGMAAFMDGFVGPESFGVPLSIAYLCFLVIGGLGRIRSIVVAALLMVVAAEALRTFAEWQMILISGLALAVLFVTSRGGLVGHRSVQRAANAGF